MSFLVDASMPSGTRLEAGYKTPIAKQCKRCLAMLLLTAAALHCAAADVQVAVAANMAAPMQKLAAHFARTTGHRAVLVPGSTGKLYAQIRNGAPFEVLLAGDDETPLRLEREGFAVAGTRFTYAVGRLVLWSAREGAVDTGGEVLRQPPRGRLAIADPRVAPYGAAAMEALTRTGVLAGWQPQLVQGESIGQAFQFVSSGNALLGLVALSQVMVDGRIAHGSAWIVPASLHQPLRQDAAVLQRGQANPAAAALLAFLRSDVARATLRAYGYGP